MSWKGASWGGNAWGSAWGNAGQGAKGGAVAKKVGVSSTVKSVLGGAAAKVSMVNNPAFSKDHGPELDAKVAKLTKDVESAEKVTNTTLESSKLVLENEKATPGALKSSQEAVEKQQGKLNDIMKGLSSESAETRKLGPKYLSQVTEITKLLTKVRGLWQNTTSTINKLKPKAVRAQAEADLKAKEAKDSAAFKPLLAKSKGEVTAAENAASDVTRKAAPIVAKPPDAGEERDKKVAAIETAAAEALKKLDEARKDLNEKTKTVLTYAPEAKKTAQAALMELQKKVTDASKTLTVYKTFKAQLPRLAENQKLITEVNEKLSGHESAIAKATDVAKAATLTKAKVQQIDTHLEPVQKAVQEAFGPLNKLRSADAVTQEKAAKLRTRAEELKKKMEAVTSKIKGQRDAIKSEEALDTAKELLEKCENVWKQCQEAEMPFLMGVEVLASEENEKALTACKDAATAATAAVNAARTHCSKSLAESKAYEKELCASTNAEIKPVMTEVGVLDAKFTKFRKELNERKVLPVIADALDAVEEFGKKVRAAETEAKALTGPGLEDQSVESVNEMIEKTKKALTEATSSGNEARNLAQKKAREAQAANNHPTIISMNKDLNEGHEKIGKLRQALGKAEQVVKTKNAITAGEEKMKEAEGDAAKAKKLVPKEGKEFTVESVAALDEACAAAIKSIRVAGSTVQPALGAASPKAKAELEKLMERKKAAQAVVDEVKTGTKERREAALSASFLAEAETKTKAAEAAAANMETAEGPFLTGAGMASSKATNELLAKCSEAAKAVSEANALARAYTAQKSQESRQFGEAAAKKVKEGFAEMAARLKTVADKLTTFEKDTRERTKESKMVEAGEKTDEVEAAVKKTLAAAEPFTKEGGDKLTEAEAEAPLKAFMEVDAETNKQLGALVSFLQTRQNEQRGNKEHLETVKKLQERVTKFKEDIAATKKATAPHEKRSLGKRLLAEAKEQVAGLDGEIKKATSACNALLEEGGEQFLVGNSIFALRNALQAHMQEKDLSVDDVFKTIRKGKTAGDKDFIKWLTDLAEATGHDELNAFSEERRQAIFKKLGTSSKGVSADDFANIFRQECSCMRPVTVTDKFEVEGSETVCKVEMNAVVEIFGRSKKDAAGLTRSECKVGDKAGWVTVKQDKGPNFLQASAPFKAFCSDMDKALSHGTAEVSKVGGSIANKMKQGGPAEDGSPLKEARDEMAKLKDEVGKAVKAMEELKKKAADAKRTFQSKEAAERTAHIEARNQKEAAPFLTEPKAKMEALEASSKATDEAGAPMVTLSGDELKAFATPATVNEAVEEHADAVKEKADAVREAIKEQTKAVAAVTPQSGGTAEAKKQLQAMSRRVEELSAKAKKTSSTIGQKCKSLTNAKMDPVAEAIRKSAHQKGKTFEGFFDSLKKGDKIPEKAFCKMLESLDVDGAALSPELAKLVCRKLEADGVSKETFMKYVVLYFKVVRTIAFTDEMDITKCKTLRKGDEGEVVEVLEGPVTDAASGMTRIRAKSLKKDDKTQGWITLSGSKGTAFLEKAAKPPPMPAAA